jgi:hypothetical protein
VVALQSGPDLSSLLKASSSRMKALRQCTEISLPDFLAQEGTKSVASELGNFK